MKGKKSVFFCENCGHEESKWLGQCPMCKEWNTFVEERIQKVQEKNRLKATDNQPVAITDIRADEETRICTGIAEMDRVLGGGLVKGSLVLVGGDPGIGKSTLLLQVCQRLGGEKRRVLYVSGEESARQVRMRGMRIGELSSSIYVLGEISMEIIEGAIQKVKPEVVIIDSIQTMQHESLDSAPGSVSQIRESTNLLLRMAKDNHIAIFIVGHVTKEGTVAGPRMLEHMVDTVLYFEGDRYASYRILRSVKNRFGGTNEIGVFEMKKEGLAEVANPSEYMLSGRAHNASGSVVACAMEGTRPMLLEIQALVCRSYFGMPRRTAVGLDYNRVNLLMAVMEKRAGINLSDQDAYVNVVGGMKYTEPSSDLGIVMALASSFKNKPIPEDTVVFGEVGLNGEVRSIAMPEQRVMECRKLGFKTCILPGSSVRRLKECGDMDIRGVDHIREALRDW